MEQLARKQDSPYPGRVGGGFRGGDGLKTGPATKRGFSKEDAMILTVSRAEEMLKLLYLELLGQSRCC